MLYLLFNKSLPIIFIIRPVGVITRKKIIPITIGAITAPKIIPNLNQSLFNGVNSFEFIKPKIKKTAEIIAAQILRQVRYLPIKQPKIKLGVLRVWEFERKIA